MGMIEYLLLTDKVEDLSSRLAFVHAQSQTRIEQNLDAIHAQTESLRGDVEELALYSRAVVSLLVDKGLLTREELVQRIEELDGEDGLVDGRLS